jgi:hypothetical protein
MSLDKTETPSGAAGGGVSTSSLRDIPGLPEVCAQQLNWEQEYVLIME